MNGVCAVSHSRLAFGLDSVNVLHASIFLIAVLFQNCLEREDPWGALKAKTKPRALRAGTNNTLFSIVAASKMRAITNRGFSGPYTRNPVVEEEGNQKERHFKWTYEQLRVFWTLLGALLCRAALCG